MTRYDDEVTSFEYRIRMLGNMMGLLFHDP